MANHWVKSPQILNAGEGTCQLANCVALVVAAGRGHRVGGPLPKQYIELGGRAVLWRTVSALAASDAIDAICVVIHPDDRALYDTALAGLSSATGAKLLSPVDGGAERQDSVRYGLQSLETTNPEFVLIHDGARPFVSTKAIDGLVRALRQFCGAILALPVTDTVKRSGDDTDIPMIAGTVDRSNLWRAQTPQGFRYSDILKAHRKAHIAVGGPALLTDDAAVAEAAGIDVALIEGDEGNFKITTQDDLTRAERVLGMTGEDSGHPRSRETEWETRVGTGFDVHRFGPGSSLMLCGVEISHEHGVLSHSDGDVALHALVDAILGSIADGDIGSHFPPSDPEWKDVASDRFLLHALERLAAQGGSLRHVDLTIICEQPKVGPHRAAMIKRLVELTGLAPGRISVKATTTEKLGFTGRGEGVAAQAVATVRLPADKDNH